MARAADAKLAVPHCRVQLAHGQDATNSYNKHARQIVKEMVYSAGALFLSKQQYNRTRIHEPRRHVSSCHRCVASLDFPGANEIIHVEFTKLMGLMMRCRGCRAQGVLIEQT